MERAVRGISCINPNAPLLETARGLKLDSTLMTARTRLGSTPWREAADSMALSTDWEVIRRPRTRSAVSGDTGSDTLKDAFVSGAAATRFVTSRAALRAAFIMAGEGRGTGFQRCSAWLQ